MEGQGGSMEGQGGSMEVAWRGKEITWRGKEVGELCIQRSCKFAPVTVSKLCMSYVCVWL